MFRSIAPFAALAFLAGCSTTATSGLSFYRPKGADQQHIISAQRVDDAVTILIDGEPAAAGEIVGKRANLFGTWRGKRVSAECGKKADGDQAAAFASMMVLGYDATTDRYTGCTVFLDGDPAAQLQIR